MFCDKVHKEEPLRSPRLMSQMFTAVSSKRRPPRPRIIHFLFGYKALMRSNIMMPTTSTAIATVQPSNRTNREHLI